MFFFSFLYCGVPDSTKSRALHALVSYVYRTLRALTPYVPRVPAMVPHVPRFLRVLVSHVSYVLLYLTCLVPCMFSGCSCLEFYVLLCSSSLACFRCFKSNMLICIPCLLAFRTCISCAFGALAI